MQDARPPVLSQNQETINILHSLSASITQYLRTNLLKEAILLTRGFYADRVAFRPIQYDGTSELRKPATPGDQEAQEVVEKGAENMMYFSRAGPQ